MSKIHTFFYTKWRILFPKVYIFSIFLKKIFLTIPPNKVQNRVQIMRSQSLKKATQIKSRIDTNFFFLAALLGLQNLSSQTRDQTQTSRSGTMESQPLDHQGIP